MASTYDMSRLEAPDRISVKIHIVNEASTVDDVKIISISEESTVAELKFEIERALHIPQSDQQELLLQAGVHSPSDDDQKLQEEDHKLSQYKLTKNSIILLRLTESSTWNPLQRNIEIPSHSNYPSLSPLAASNADRALNKQPATDARSQAQSTQQAAELDVDQIVHFLTKHSKIQCRILLIVFEITLVLLVAYWGSVSMIQYCINMVFILIGWRGCRKLKPFFIVCFLLYLIMDLVIIFLLIILGIVEKHESVYGSTALYVGLLSLEFVLNSIWLYWYAKFFYAVLKALPSVRERAREITAKQPILI
eukprot:CAMPEP_0197031752 /NCGR_PEP_ID=MMETSP1384-20130603/10654_1 /TAXON_ID=29189 /ORGANISM="Ammonia sp." /LENGTH=307 /DNA_ID=CAMNT_0042461323 /DNA_START=49 /DNA_END=972 /DNA_ORIENTATION=-